MNKPFNVLFVVLLSVMTMSSQSKQVNTINNNWKFHKGDFEVDKNDAIKGLMLSNDTNWETINIPHTWNNIDTTDDIPGYFRGVVQKKHSD